MSQSEARFVICKLVSTDNDRVRLVLEDARATTSGGFETTRLYTEREFETEEFMGVELSDEQLADIGLAIVARLVALGASRQ